MKFRDFYLADVFFFCKYGYKTLFSPDDARTICNVNFHLIALFLIVGNVKAISYILLIMTLPANFSSKDTFQNYNSLT